MRRMDALLQATNQLSEDLAGLSFAEPVTHVYNPLEYAWRSHEAYVKRFGNSKKRVVFLGMNPGPFGMAQTGVPFGEVAAVRDWLGIEEPVDQPDNEHPKRPVVGFECTRSEVSGRRLWGLFAERFKKPTAFFKKHYIANYCPLVFMEAGGRNRTPDKLTKSERLAVYAACDTHLRALVATLEPEWVIGVGDFALKRAQETLADVDCHFGKVLHPSPASPAANRGWAEQAQAQMIEMDLWE